MEHDACDVGNDDHVPDPNFSLKGLGMGIQALSSKS
jgi:hypothetical protein